MFAGIGFLSPMLLFCLLALPAIWWLLRATPPAPNSVDFPATRLLQGLKSKDTETAKTPWWLTLLRMLAAALVIFALADPVLNPQRSALEGNGPVAIIVDNGWGAAKDWDARMQTVQGLISQAERNNRPLTVLTTAGRPAKDDTKPSSAKGVRERMAALEPAPHASDRTAALNRLIKAQPDLSATALVWVSDPLDYGQATDFKTKLSSIDVASLRVVTPPADATPLGVRRAPSNDGTLKAEIVRTGGANTAFLVSAKNTKGETLATATGSLSASITNQKTTVTFELPLELRNQVTQITIDREASAGAVHLLDASSRWNRIGLFDGSSQEQAQPLLAPLYYIDRALRPFGELVRTNAATINDALNQLLEQKTSTIILADIGNITGEADERLQKFIAAGGVLVRFAGPRLEKANDQLLPAPLRFGGRTLGGALSWSTPQTLAPFDEASIFSGLAVPSDVRIRRQVLVDPARLSPDTQVWARLSDGTPLVTAQKRSNGWLILFHVTGNSDWSNLPLSGLFVDMLRRLSTLSSFDPTSAASLTSRTSVPTTSANPTNPDIESTRVLTPVLTVSGFGLLGAVPAGTKSVSISAMANSTPSADHPPGFYGPADSPRAFNLITGKTELAPIGDMPSVATIVPMAAGAETLLKPWLLFFAISILFADIIATMLLRGLRFPTRPQPAAAALALFGLVTILWALASPTTTAAQNSATPRAPATSPPAKTDQDLAHELDVASRTRLAYVITGDQQLDNASRAGLAGLTRMLIARTAVEPAEPIGVRIATDELAFFPVLYWPIPNNVDTLSDTTLSRIDAYMKRGGMIIFDTRDANTQIDGLPQASGPTPLQKLLGKLDIPRLEPVPPKHVLARSFYLLSSFPGRYDNGKLWVEARSSTEGGSVGRARRADGVSSILITGNDFARAWALDADNRPIYPVVPGGEVQRELAFRVGVNIVMYALTGNYKADQVHVPALLERLGQ